MKNKTLIFALITTGIMALASCASGGNETSSSGGDSSSQSSESSSSSENTITNDDLEKASTTYTGTDGETHNLTRSRIYAASGAPHLDSYPEDGNKQMVLVAPIRFEKDATDSNDTITADDTLLSKIELAFNGTDEEMRAAAGAQVYSLESFYNQSSFGKANMDCVVLPCWIDWGGTAKEFQASTSSAGVTMSSYVKTWYNTEYAKTDHGALGADWEYTWADFDSDGDGYIDLLWQMYAYPQSSGDTSFWWAYVTYTGNSANIASPNIQTLAWASTSFMSSFNGYDTHTLIHETGHALGANDYYDYNNTWRPMSTIDFMDGNVGDHNAYTKFMYGWVNPWVLKEEDLEGGKTATITLRAQTLTGDCLVLASPNYNGTAFDEYFMVELIGPYGLAERDYNSGYESAGTLTEPGIRILHIDGRMSGSNHNTYITDPDTLGNSGGDTRVSNTFGGRVGYRTDSDFWPNEDGELEGDRNADTFTEAAVMESTFSTSSNWTTTYNHCLTTESLFTAGNRFYLKRNGNLSGWAETFMPSGSNLWNKAKTITSMSGSTQTYTIDETMTCDFYLRVNSIVEDPTYGAIATLTVSLSE